jgi:hypothetical protein
MQTRQAKRARTKRRSQIDQVKLSMKKRGLRVNQTFEPRALDHMMPGSAYGPGFAGASLFLLQSTRPPTLFTIWHANDCCPCRMSGREERWSRRWACHGLKTRDWSHGKSVPGTLSSTNLVLVYYGDDIYFYPFEISRCIRAVDV